MKRPGLALILSVLASALPSALPAQSFSDLLSAADRGETAVPAAPQAAAPAPAEGEEPPQYLPPNNAEPGFEWPSDRKDRAAEEFFYIGASATFLKISPDQAADLATGSGKCALEPNTLYKAAARPGFEGEHMTVQLAEPLPGCQFSKGYIYMTHVSSSSAGGAWELPRTARAFLDTLAFAEGTESRYNYIFTFVTFKSYADHPRRKICSGGLCSTAAGRYQFLSKTWDGLAPDLGLKDFTPPSQDKATMEIIRRAGAYNAVLKSSVYENFTAALKKLNTTWASLPGSPYGQPTHGTAELWKVYKAALAKY